MSRNEAEEAVYAKFGLLIDIISSIYLKVRLQPLVSVIVLS
jgi:hypothetical protein